MAKNYGYTSVDRIFSKLDRDITSTFNEDYIIEWIGEALEHIGVTNQFEEAVAFIEVKNHQCVVPKYCGQITQIARDTRWSPVTKNKECTPKAIIDEIPSVVCKKSTNCEDEKLDYVVLDCQGTPVMEYGIAYYRPYFDLKAERLEFANTSYYASRYTPVRKADGNFFNELTCNEGEVNQRIHNYSDDKYRVIKGEILRFSFKDGFVAVAFKRQIVDEETGYPMIPDNVSYTEAIKYYIVLKMCEKEFFKGREGSKGRLDVAQSNWTWYCAQACAVDMMPDSIDDYQNIGDMRNKMIPVNEYNTFFGNLSNPEYRKWNDPDYRNIKNRVVARPV